MLTTELVRLGQIVKSIAGLDRGRVFIITKIVDESYVLVVDGDLRRISNPKRKKIMHLQITNTVLEELLDDLNNQKLQDAQVRKTLDVYKLKGMGVK